MKNFKTSAPNPWTSVAPESSEDSNVDQRGVMDTDTIPVAHGRTSVMRSLGWTRKQHAEIALQLSQSLPKCGPKSQRSREVTRAICDHLLAVVSAAEGDSRPGI